MRGYPERQVTNAAQLPALRAPSLSWTAVDANNVLGLHDTGRASASGRLATMSAGLDLISLCTPSNQ